MSKRLTAHEPVYDVIVAVAEDREISYKEALRDIVSEAGYEV